ncbi:hypothetical protein [Acholeplasma granularum]|uniref:hypothetical protein n=1 Tax=Acholeplasma granularum TaxID=264635 RepID=UPI00046EAB79|nr:hypothetical protein [Acholeplasma granularum]
MTLTKRQWILFTLFIIEFAYTLLNVSLSGDLRILSSNLSTLLFLGALYLEHSFHSKRVLLLSGVWLIVNGIFLLFQLVPSVLLSLHYLSIILLISLIMSYIAIYFFSMKYYRSEFFDKKDNIKVTIFALPLILFNIYSIYMFFSMLNTSNILLILYGLVGYFSSMIIPVAIILYTWLNYKNIN